MDIPNQAALFEGYGEATLAEANELVKALQAQEGITDIAALQAGGALQPQSLETQLALLTFQEKHIKFYKKIGVTKAFSTLEEYSIQDGYGTEGGFVGQMENPDEADAEFRRQFAVVKYIRTLWRVSDVLMYAKTISDAEVLNVQASMMRALRTTEKQLFFGDSSVIPQGFDGIVKAVNSLAPGNVIDMRNATMNEFIMKQGAEMIAANYGTATEMYTSLGVQTTIDNILGKDQQRNIQNMISGDGKIALGHSVPMMKTSYGNFEFVPDIFINPESQGVPMIKNPSVPGALIEGATAQKAPAMPTFTLTPTGAPVANSQWHSSGDGGAIAGEYYYRVVAVNQYGKSQAAAAQAVTSVAGEGITIDITPGVGTYAPTGYEIYRDPLPGMGASNTKRYLMKAIPASGSPTTFVDINDDIAGSSVAILVDNTTAGEMRTMALSQLAPMHKVEYAKIGPYRWGTVNFYIVPKWYAPNRFVIYKNVGVGNRIRNPLVDL